MLSFESDYTEGAHEKILARLLETNLEQLPGYGNDRYTESAKRKIRAAVDCPGADVFFLSGGTQTNAAVIGSLLKPYEGVAAAQTGHINTHEAGAVECTGHKVLELAHHDGKIDPGELSAFLEAFWEDQNHEHMVFPGMVHLSHPTEYGTLYTKDELLSISAICRSHGIWLYLDGARLGYGLAADGTDVTLPLIAACCDVFYLGGTKVGALCGEAVVFPSGNAPRNFTTMIKQRGALLAKGRLLGIQFDVLFTDNLYFELGRHAIEMAKILKAGFAERDIPFYLDSPTNQQFVILDNSRMEALSKEVRFSFWERLDEARTVVRFATSWATRREDVQTLLSLL